MVLRYGNRMALLWTTRRIVAPVQPAAPPTDVAQRMAATSAVQAAPPPQASSSATQNATINAANVTALYTDKLTGGR